MIPYVTWIQFYTLGIMTTKTGLQNLTISEEVHDKLLFWHPDKMHKIPQL